jgi:high-affinity nickel permease
MRLRPLLLALSTAATVLALPTTALAAWGHNGNGFWDMTSDLNSTLIGFAIIGFFPMVALVGSTIQHFLHKRADRRAEAKHISDWPGGW